MTVLPPKRGREKAVLLLAMALAAGSFSLAIGEEATPAPNGDLPQKVSFNEHIRPIFAKHCVACHGGVKQASGLSFIYRDLATGECDSGNRPIVPGNSKESYLIERITDADLETRMPPSDHGPPLSKRDVELLRRWIDQGAEWELHWSFVAPKPQTVPGVKHDAWPRDPLDNFILAKLESAGLAPAPEADRATWLRRASLDLTGMPPTADEYAAFELDNRPDAYERAADRLFASPHFGERWASMWLDVARYADTQGYEKDNGRDIWPYRDWVIRAFNADMPFDEFTVKQHAGDLLPNATLADRLATAFNRNTQTNTEGGTDDEEYRTVAVLDRVSTVWQTWQGMTFRCTQCHSHPYDPFRHDEFSKFIAFFNTSRDADLNGDEPVLRVPNDEAKWSEAQRLDEQIAKLRQQTTEQTAALATDHAQWTWQKPVSAEVNGDARLVVRDDPSEKVPEVLAKGTVPQGCVFTLKFTAAKATRVTALRIDALPPDLEAALKTPAAGFVLSRLKAHVASPEGADLGEIKFVAAACDEADPLFDVEESMRDNPEGWEQYTRQTYPRWAVFIPEKPVDLPAGGSLRLALHFGLADSGAGALYIQRARFALSESPAWTALVGSQAYHDAKEQLAALLKQRQAIPATAVPVMGEQEPQDARRTYVFTRGNWLDKDREVQPGVPAVMPPLPAGVRADRLAMARWFASKENPLTARVMVNRLWQELFGAGIVETAEDFGTSGELPSHPELLDYLALRFQNEDQWSVKRMLRELVLSATYRQSSVLTAEKLDKDARNRLLSRGPRTRLTAEMVRDQALVLSGRFSPKMFGQPVMPPQPDGVWRSVYNGAKWKTAKGENRYRRAVYTYWKRTSGYPSMLTFDVPSRDVCVVRRIATNTPLQALVTLNDQAFVELAQGFAERMDAVDGDEHAKIAAGYEQATGHRIEPEKLARLAKLYDEAAAAFDAHQDEAKPLAATRDRYALCIVANAILNLDEVLTK
jgi:hypothetical protein